MAPSDMDPFQDTDETHAALMRATYDALCKHGYAGLTIQRIGDEFPKSKSLIYQHYDGKDELLVAFLGFMSKHFEDEAEIPIDDDRDALDQLQDHLNHLLDPSLDEERYEFMSAMTELRAQAPHDEAYRAHFTKSDQIFHEHISDIIRTGIEQGEFRDVDPEQTAELLLTTIDGAMLRRVTTDGSVDIQAVRDELDEYIRSRLLLKE
jgi:AcrR family transcriptional regulator